MLAVSPTALIDKNLFVYCDNNPINRKDLNGKLWIVSIAVGIATQYIGDVIGNIFDGKTGTDIFMPTSTIGEYVAAGVTALIPGSGMVGALVRNVATEAIVSVERHIKGQEIILLMQGNNTRKILKLRNNK